MIFYVTGNKNKFEVAKKHLLPLGVEIKQRELDLEEIQTEDIEKISKYKATQAFEALQKPLITNDHGWSITALNGFPGAYMKYINKWFSARDLTMLMQGKGNREAVLTEVLTYIDHKDIKSFTMMHKGEILDNPQGEGPIGKTMISLSGDKISIAKKLETGLSAVKNYTLWEAFAKWYKER